MIPFDYKSHGAVRPLSSFAWRMLLSFVLLASSACGPKINPPPAAQKTVPTAAAPAPTAETPKTLPTTVQELLPPTVAEVFPPSGSVVSPADGLTLTFSEPMERASVEAALQLEGSALASLRWQGDSLLYVYPQAALPPDSSFSVRIEDSARAANGLTLPQPLTFSFKTPGEFTLSERFPAPGGVDVNPAAPLAVTFNQSIVPLSAESSTAIAAFTLSPPAAGQGEWRNASTYVFYPRPALAGGTTYTATLAPDLTSLAGMALTPDEAGASWQFTTAQPDIVSFTPDNTASLFLDDAFTLTFNQPMDTASVKQNLTLQDAVGKQVAGKLEWDSTDTTLTFTPTALLARDTAYTLILPRGTLSQGGAALPADLAVDFRTVGLLNPTLTNPAPGQPLQVSGGFASLTLTFNAPLSKGDLTALITLEPPVSNLSLYVDNSRQNVFISGFFEPSTEYQVRLSPELRDRWETRLGKEVILSVLSSPAQPALTIPMLLVGSPSLFLTPQDKELPVQATNIDSVKMAYTPISLEDYLLASSPYSLEEITITNPQWTRWEQPLELTPNRGEAVNLSLTPEGLPLEAGLYYFQLSPRTAAGEKPFDLSFLAVVSPIQLTLKRSAGQVIVWAVNLADLAPVEGREVRLVNKTNTVLSQGVTGKDGLATLAVLTDSEDFFDEYFAVLGEASSPDFSLASTNWNNRVSGWAFGIPTDLSGEKPFAYLYSDRPIYRPGHTLYFRAVVRDAENGRYTLPNLKQITVKLWGAQNTRPGETPAPLSTLTLPVSEYGTAEGSILIPENAPPGSYTLVIEEIRQASLLLRVEEYRRPEVDLEAQFAQVEFLPGDPIEAVVNARYFFGEAAAGVKVNWALYAREEYFSLSAGYSSGKSNAAWLNPYWWAGFDPLLGRYLIEGSGVTDQEGQLNLSLKAAELSYLDREQLQMLTLEATLQAEGEYPLSSRATALLHPADFYIGIRPDVWSGVAGSELGYAVRTVDWKGAPRAVESLRAEFQQITWEPFKTESWNPNGPSQEPRYTRIGSTDFSTDANGRARLAFTPPEPGSYQIEISGGGALTQKMVWVSGESDGTWPNLPDQHIQLETDQESYQPGDTANIFLPNPFTDGALALVSIERGRVMRTEVIPLTQPSHLLGIPLTAEDAPNVFVSVTLLGRLPGGIPDFRQGYREIKVAPTRQELQVTLTPNQSAAEPGDKVNFTLEVKDASGQPVVGEFSLAVVDKATLALVGQDLPGILDAFYGPQNLGVLNSLSLAAYARRIALLPPGLGGGGGGMMISPIREDFPDTAYWNARIETDQRGTAQVSLNLPDNLTTWVADLRGLTRDSKVGQASQEIIVSKDLLIRPQTPRFLVVGDHTRIGAVVRNNTAQDLNARVSIQAKGLELDASERVLQQIELPAHGQAPVYWWGTVQDAPDVELIFNAQAGDLSDSTRPVQGNIPVYVYVSPEVFGTSGVLSQAGERLEVIALPPSYTPTGGSLEVQLTQSLAAGLIRDLDALESTPTDFTPTVLSRLLSNLAAVRLLRDLGSGDALQISRLEGEILKDMEQALALQDDSGGWGWGASSAAEPWFTSYALFALTQADEAGYLLEAPPLRRAQDYLTATLFRPTDAFESWQLDRLAFQVFALQRAGQDSGIAEALYDFREKMNPWARALLALTLYQKNPQDARAATLLDGLKAGAVVSSTGANWEDTFSSYANGSTANYSTAVVLYTLSRMDPASPLADQAAQYLAYHRQAGGGWASPYENAWVLLALTEALRGTGDLQASFGYSASLNGAPLLQKSEGGWPSLSAEGAAVPLTELRASGGNALRISREAGTGTLYYRAFLELHRTADTAPPLNRGLTVARSYFRDEPQCRRGGCEPLNEIELTQYSGAVLVRVSLTAPRETAYLVVEDFIPAGTEIINPALETSQIGASFAEPGDGELLWGDFFTDNWGAWYFTAPQIYDNRIRWSAERLPAGSYELTYRLAPMQAGKYHILPTHAYLSFYPDVEGRAGGAVLTIRP